MLMMVIGAIITMHRFPDTPLARLLHRWLVDAPTARLARVHPAQLIFVVIVAGVLVAGGEVVLLMGGAEAAMALSWQLSLYLDAGIALAAAGALTRLKPFIQMVVHRRPRRPRVAGRRRRTPAASCRPANDDDRPALAA
jgi:hypothetical protein